jgi:hypothetical protein
MVIQNNQIALLSFYTKDFQPLHNITGQNKDDYCAKWGYHHLVKVAPYGNPDNYYAFQRIQYLYDLLFNNLPEGREIEAVLVMNTHSLVTNYNIQIQSFLDDDHDFYLAKDVSGLQMGLYLVKKTEWLKRWLEYILSFESVHQNKFQKEQTVIQEIWQAPEWFTRIKIVDQEQLGAYVWKHYGWAENSPGAWKPGSFTLHVPGKSTIVGTNKSLFESRIEIFSSDEMKNRVLKE